MDDDGRDRLLSADDGAVVDAGGTDPTDGEGSRRPGEHPLVLVVDVQRHLVGSDAPILDAIERDYRTAAGERAWRAIEHIERLLATARHAGVQIAYTRVIPEPSSGLGPEDVVIAEQIAPEDGDWVVDKPRSSAFHATDLGARLVRRGVDTLVLFGCSTGSCVRTTAVDAHRRGYAVVLPEACSFDRIQAAHEQALFDVDGRYGHVEPRERVEDYLLRTTSDP